MKIDRRKLIKGFTVTALAGPVQSSPAALAAPHSLAAIEAAANQGNRRWLGRNWWANRLQDWQRNGAWIECLKGQAGMELRTAALLTHDLGAAGDGTLVLRIAADTELGRGGFGGWLIGVGGGKLHPLAAALAQRGSGRGGGILAVVDADGIPQFREHTDERKPLAFKPLEAHNQLSAKLDLATAPCELRLTIEDRGGGRCRLRLSSLDQQGAERASATLDGVPGEYVSGGLALASSPPAKAAGARFRFSDIRGGGARLGAHPTRALGPCLAALHSLAGGVLKMSAHFALMGERDAKGVVLEISQNGRWRRVAQGEIGAGSCALLRVENWDARRAARYRLRYAASGKPETVYEGTIPADPVHTRKQLAISIQGCVLSTQRGLEDSPGGAAAIPGGQEVGRYEPANFNFPHAGLVAHSLACQPDLVFIAGDQYYENNPTRPERNPADVELDTLYRWQQWLVSFRDLVRDRPSILLVDDHDVLHGNLWGNGGRSAPDHDPNQGGYAAEPALVRMVYRMQCGHNPDPLEPAPVENELPVSYTAFLYGGTSIAIVEDRKWKTSPVQGKDMDVHVAHLLGPRQEAFLARWKDMHPGAPKVLLSQSSWVCLQTDPEGAALTDFDSNGYPPLARRRATALAKAAGCVMLANDQHLPSLVRMGVDRFDDGPVQFVGPAGGALWQRWFEPAGRLANARAGMEDRTGDWTDAFGNPMRVLAVANARISYADFRKHIAGRSQILPDRSFKPEGFGVLRVDRASSAYVFECWPWNKGPSDGEGAQFAGWPYRLPFDQV